MIIPRHYEDLQVLRGNTMASRAYYIPASRRMDTLVERREDSDRMQLLNGQWQFAYYASIYDLEDRRVAQARCGPGGSLVLDIPSPVLWNPEAPYLYTLVITTPGEVIVDLADQVEIRYEVSCDGFCQESGTVEGIQAGPGECGSTRLKIGVPKQGRAYLKLEWKRAWYNRAWARAYDTRVTRDKHQASCHGWYGTCLEDLHEDYIRPQENGSRGDCDYVILRAQAFKEVPV